ncbi:hypothetical protein IAT38_006935 [Cryptococcus sp. DSM 104549]
MSNDWWSTPSRPAPTPAQSAPALGSGLVRSQSTSRAARFAGDELDPEDNRMADSIKFLPSFASSTAGKLALGTSPSAGGGLGSPQESRRSPQAGRYGGATQERDGLSPRHTRARNLAQQSAAISAAQSAAMDEDMPPTASLRDSSIDTRVATLTNSSELQTPSSLIPTPTTTTLHIFGPPMEVLGTMKDYLSQFGPVASYRAGPAGSNWYIVDFSSPTAAAFALRRHGDIVGGRWMVAFKVASAGSTAGCTLVEGGDGLVGAMGVGPGTPIQVQNRQIIRAKPAAQAVAKTKSGGNEYGWDEPEAQAGWTGWVSERLFGR